jgi:hypothetical protein
MEMDRRDFLRIGSAALGGLAAPSSSSLPAHAAPAAAATAAATAVEALAKLEAFKRAAAFGCDYVDSQFSLLYRGYFFSQQDFQFQHFLGLCAQLFWKIAELPRFNWLAAE